MLMPVRALALLLLAATAQAPCTWEGGPGCPDPTTPCVDWLGDTPAVDCVNSCDQLGANDIYCIASWVRLASADGECTYDMYAAAGFDFLNNPEQVTVCDISTSDTETDNSSIDCSGTDPNLPCHVMRLIDEVRDAASLDDIDR